MVSNLKELVASGILALCLTAPVSAATVTYNNSETSPNMQLEIDDSASGSFRFSLSTLVGTADFLGLGFNFAGSSITQSDITLVSATRADNSAISPTLALFGNNTGSQSSCGGGCNFNGSGSASLFDYIIRIGDNGGNANNFVKTVVFDIAAAGSLAMNPFSQFAVRAQSTSNQSGSIKTDLSTPVSPIPLPAGLPLLLAGVCAIGILRRRKSCS